MTTLYYTLAQIDAERARRGLEPLSADARIGHIAQPLNNHGAQVLNCPACGKPVELNGAPHADCHNDVHSLAEIL